MTDITRFRGDTYADEITVVDQNNVPIDVTGFTFLLTVDPSPAPVDDTNNLFQISGIITDGPNGRVQFAPNAVEADQTPNVYFYDIQMKNGSIVRTVEAGKYTIRQDVTKTP